MNEQLKRFIFFNQDPIQDKPNPGPDITLPTLNDIEISQNGAIYIEPRLYFCCKKKATVYVYENNSIIGCFTPYTDTLNFVEKNTTTKEGFLLTYGIDNENNIKTSYIKIWDPESLDLANKNQSKNIFPLIFVLFLLL